MNIRKFIASLVLAFALLPVAFASTEFKGTETVNINKANAATLAAYLKGIGPNKAEAIVKYRKANGKFKGIEDLKNVPGIGDETFKDVKKNVSTSRGKTVAPEGYKMAETSGKSSSSKKTTKKKSSTGSEKKTSDTEKSTSSKKSSTAKKSTTDKTDKKSSSDKKSKTSKKTKAKKETKTKTKKASKSSDSIKKKVKSTDSKSKKKKSTSSKSKSKKKKSTAK